MPVPASGVLSAWSAHDWRDGVHVEELAALERLIVKTENSTYDIVLLSPDTAHILVTSPFTQATGLLTIERGHL